MKIIKIIIAFTLLIWIAGFFVFLSFVNNIKNENISYIENSIVLTGGQNRIEEAINLLDNDLTGFVFISGVNAKVNKKDILGDNYNNYKNKFYLGYEAVNTKGNVMESEKWIAKYNIGKVRIITSDYHVPRSKLEFNKILPEFEKEIYSISSIDKDFLSSLSNWKILFKEYNKFIYVFFGSWSGLAYAKV